jgi:heme-degrading monooxygenase HmoA
MRTQGDNGYSAMADRMVELASSQPGFIGVESVRSQDGFGITVSYWESESAIKAWREHFEHKIAQEFGISKWYEHFKVRVAKVERSYGM